MAGVVYPIFFALTWKTIGLDQMSSAMNCTTAAISFCRVDAKVYHTCLDIDRINTIDHRTVCTNVYPSLRTVTRLRQNLPPCSACLNEVLTHYLCIYKTPHLRFNPKGPKIGIKHLKDRFRGFRLFFFDSSKGNICPTNSDQMWHLQQWHAHD